MPWLWRLISTAVARFPNTFGWRAMPQAAVAAPTPQKGRWLSDCLGWLRQRPIISTAALASAPIVLVVVAASIDRRTLFEPSETTGQIFVNGPQIYTRERLVNDRYREDAWLQRQAERTDDEAFDPVDAVLLRMERRFELEQRFGVRLPGAAPGAVHGQNDSEIESEPATDRSGAASIPTSAGGPIAHAARLLPLAKLEEKEAYRQRLRTLMLANQLDDRHDLKGNSLFLLSFDVSVLPGARTHSTAKIKVEVRPPAHLLGGKATKQAILRAHSIASLDRPLVEAWNATYQEWLRSKTAEYQSLRSSLRQDFADSRLSKSDYQFILANLGDGTLTGPQTELFNDDADQIDRHSSYKQHIETIVQRAIQTECGLGQGVPGCRPGSGGGSYSIVYKVAKGPCATEIGDHFPDAIPSEASKGQNPNGSVYAGIQSTLPRSNRVINDVLDIYVERALRSSPFGTDLAYQTKYARIGIDYDRDPPVAFQPLSVRLHATRSSKHLQECWREVDVGGNIKVYVAKADLDALYDHVIEMPDGGPAVYSPQMDIKQKSKIHGSSFTVDIPVGLLQFMEASARQFQVFGYAISPRGYNLRYKRTSNKGGATRIFSASEVHGSLVGWLGRADLDQVSSVDMSAIGTQSIIVGWGQQTADDVASFGWFINPQELENAGSAERFRHRASQYSVSALVSLPAWWNEVGLVVETAWLDEDGREIEPSAPTSFPVKLPLDMETLEALLFPNESRTPVATRGVSPLQVQACQPAEFVIPGQRLWRSSVVTLGGQRASEIVVLPDMRGVVATFDLVTRGPKGKDEVRPLKVWTSEGSTLAARVKIEDHPGQYPGCPARGSSSTASSGN